jgi:hypothetical protein
MIFPWKRFHVILFEEISTKLYIASLLNLKLKKEKKKKKIPFIQTFFQPVTLIPTPPLIKTTPPPVGRCSKPKREKEGERESKTFLLTYLRTFDNSTSIFK